MNNKAEDIITELLPMTGAEELRKFVIKDAGENVEFAVNLSQWLMSRYGVFVKTALQCSMERIVPTLRES